MKLTRKNVLLGAFGLTFVGLTGCGGGDSGGGSPPPQPNPGSGTGGANCLQNGTASAISNNHGHALTVSKEDVAAGTQKTYSITGSADHPHQVTVTAAQFATLAANNPVTVTSTTDDGHSHDVTVTCAG